MDSITRTRILDLYPELARIWTNVDGMLMTLGITVRVTQGLRTWSQQNTIWRIGRDAEGNIVDPGKVVTHAKGGESYHNYGLALDFVPMVEDYPVWDRTHPWYAKTIEISESMGLVSGSKWPEPKTDFPHLQLTGPFPEDEPDDYCKSLWRDGGPRAVWDEVDRFLNI